MNQKTKTRTLVFINLCFRSSSWKDENIPKLTLLYFQGSLSKQSLQIFQLSKENGSKTESQMVAATLSLKRITPDQRVAGREPYSSQYHQGVQ